MRIFRDIHVHHIVRRLKINLLVLNSHNKRLNNLN